MKSGTVKNDSQAGMFDFGDKFLLHMFINHLHFYGNLSPKVRRYSSLEAIS